MTKIIRLDTSKKVKPGIRQDTSRTCEHKNVTVYTAHRNVRCTICGELLDPFDVLADMVKGHIPGGRGAREEKKFLAEVKKRKEKKDTGDDTDKSG